MAVKYSDATLLAQGANPPGEVRTQDQHGRVRCLTASYTFVAADASGTSIFIGTLPKGARVLSGSWAMDGGPATAVSYNIGGLGTGAHSLNETFDTKDSWRGTQRAVLLAVALAR